MNKTPTQHTPGPWKVGVQHRIETPTPGGGCVVLVSERQITGNTFEQGVANARLIAAAPEMLESLQAIYDDPYSTCSCAEKARAAIAKATGT